MSKLRALLVLGRVSNLPTVWSNCLAAWLLGGDGGWSTLVWICAAATLVYSGGMYLNDVFDMEFDRNYRRERPIPSGAISSGAVWAVGGMMLAAGALLMAVAADAEWPFVLLLTSTVVVYDAVHKRVPFAPLLMAACRFFLYLGAASAGRDGVDGTCVWAAAVMGAYIVGLSSVARAESVPTPFSRAALVLLAAPLVLAVIRNDDEYRTSALILSFAAGGWVLLSLRHALVRVQPDIGRTVGALLAGIPLVDLLAVGWQGPELTAAFAGLFVLALLGQRFVPAT